MQEGRNLDMLEKWPGKNLRSSKKAKCKVLQGGWNNPTQQDGVGVISSQKRPRGPVVVLLQQEPAFCLCSKDWKISSTTKVLSLQGVSAEAMVHTWALFTSTQGEETDPARTSRFLFRITKITFS